MPTTNKTLTQITNHQYTTEELKMIENLKNMKDENIDFSDIPDFGIEVLKYATKKNKQSVTIRIAQKNIEYFKNLANKTGVNYQTIINNVLDEFVNTHSN